tara:strand:+ start:100 stop:672 length:573 start_codon:yes stop_codon:yes gene_type:complete
MKKRKGGYKDLPIEQIVRSYNNNISSVKLGELYDVNYLTILNRLREAGVEIKKAKAYKYEGAEIALDYKRGMGVSDIARKHQVSNPHVYNILHDFKIPLRYDQPPEKITKEEMEHIIEMYQDRSIKVKDICSKYSIDPKTLRNKLKKHGVKMRSKTRRTKKPNDFDHSLNVKQVMEIYGVSEATAYRWLK